MQPGDSGGGERRYGYGDKTEVECSLGTVVGENGGMDTEIRQRVSAGRMLFNTIPATPDDEKKTEKNNYYVSERACC